MQSNQRGRPLPVAGLATVAKRNREEQEEEEEHNTTTATTRGERHVEVSARNVDVTLMPVCVCVCVGVWVGVSSAESRPIARWKKGEKYHRDGHSDRLTSRILTAHYITLPRASSATVPRPSFRQKKTTQNKKKPQRRTHVTQPFPWVSFFVDGCCCCCCCCCCCHYFDRKNGRVRFVCVCVWWKIVIDILAISITRAPSERR